MEWIKKEIIRFFRLRTGKDQEDLRLIFSFYYFLTRSKWRSYWLVYKN